MNLPESIAAILAMHEGRMLRARVALLELAEELETSSPRGRPDLEEPSERIRAIARELAPPTREPGACTDHPPAETLDVISCVVCGAWKPSKESPLVFIGSDGVHRAVRNSPTPPAPAPCPAEWREEDGELARCELEEGHAGAHHYRNVLEKGVPLGEFVRVLRKHLPSEKASEDSLSAKPGGSPAERAGENGPSDTSGVFSEGAAVVRMLREKCAACDVAIHSIEGSPLVVCAECLWRARLQREGSLKLANEVTDMFVRLTGDSAAKCVGGCGRYAIDGKATCGRVRCGSTTGRGLPASAGAVPDEKASVPDQKNAVAGEAENKGDAPAKSPPLSDQQCECRERAHGKRCPMPATHRVARSFPGVLTEFYYYCADCAAFRVPRAQRIDGSGVDDFLYRACPNHDEAAR